MKKIAFLIICFFIDTLSYANEIEHDNCRSIQEIIVKETREIANANPTDYEELAQLYVSRGESFLLDAQYEKAIEDFQNASIHLAYVQNSDDGMVIAFRAEFGKVVSYDNLGMQEQTQQSIQQLQAIVDLVGCKNCIEKHPCSGIISPYIDECNLCDIFVYKQNQDCYEDILGPNQAPEPEWCEEVVVGVGRAMDAIACLARNHGVKMVLIGIIEGLIARGVKCCQAGGFWKACVAPITRKWREWENNKEKYILPNPQNLSHFTS